MRSTVVIKGNRSGMSVYLDPQAPFEQVLEDVEKKFRESAKFWGSVQMALTIEGRKRSAAEEYQVVNAITGSSQVEILCLIDQDGERIRRCEKALNEKLMELVHEKSFNWTGVPETENSNPLLVASPTLANIVEY